MSSEKKETINPGEPLTGLILLGGKSWDRRKFYKDVRKDWNIQINENDARSGVIISKVGNCVVTIMFRPSAVPNGEAEKYAEGNYLWPEAAETVKKHKSHIIVTVIGNTTNKEKATVYTQITTSLLKQTGALAVYSGIAVYQPQFYTDYASLIKCDEFPVMNVVWIGVFTVNGLSGAYTFGMRKFGKEEMEFSVPESEVDVDTLRNFMFGLSVFILGHDITLKDGDVVGITPEQKISVELSAGKLVEGQSFKVTFCE